MTADHGYDNDYDKWNIKQPDKESYMTADHGYDNDTKLYDKHGFGISAFISGI
jgi:hypothetical protein